MLQGSCGCWPFIASARRWIFVWFKRFYLTHGEFAAEIVLWIPETFSWCLLVFVGASVGCFSCLLVDSPEVMEFFEVFRAHVDDFPAVQGSGKENFSQVSSRRAVVFLYLKWEITPFSIIIICSEIVNHQVIQQFGASSTYWSIWNDIFVGFGYVQKTYKN